MGCTCFHGAALFFSVTALALTLGALTTTSWMTASISFGSSISAMKGVLGTSADSALDLLTNRYRELDIFYNQGLIRESISAGNLFNASFFIDAQKTETFILITSFAFIVAAVISFIGIIILMASLCGENSYEAKSLSGCRTRTAMIVLTVSGFFLLFGMSLYTGASTNERHNPMKFMANFEASSESSFKSVMNNKIGNIGDNFLGNLEPNGWDRKKRDIPANPMAIMLKILREMVPVYGYSFLMGWVASLLMLISAMFAAAGRHYLVNQPYDMTVKA